MSVAPPETGDSVMLELLEAVCGALLRREDELNALDREIGDGDHGSNMARAARGLRELRAGLAGKTPGTALAQAGNAIVMSSGGASGPLYGSLLMMMGRALPDDPALPDIARAFRAGVDEVARRGRSAEGDKTMLDVLVPAARALSENVGDGAPAALAAMLRAALGGLADQRSLRAARGRAAYVGERSIGHDDPGAASSAMCISVIADIVLQEQSS